MRPRTKSSLLWGVVGGLSFLVLVQGYELVGEPGIGAGAKVGVALLVGVVTVGVAYRFEGRVGTAGAGGGRIEGASEVDGGDETSDGPDTDEGENRKGRV